VSELRDEIPLLEGSIAYGEGKSWGGKVAVARGVLTTLSAAGQIVRASNNGGWWTSRPRWASMRSWLGEEITPLRGDEAVAQLVGRWLRAFGPGTAADLKWWLGSTFAAVRRALADLDTVESASTASAGTCSPTTSSRPIRSNPGPRYCRGSTRPQWAGASGPGTSGRTATSCSTPSATPGPRRGGTDGSSAAGAKPTAAKSNCGCSRTSTWRDAAPSSTRRPA
jgi:hypothetical protein